MMWRKALDAIKGRLGRQDAVGWILTDRTQFDEPAPKGRKLQLVIGLDFGTAFTKVVIGEQRIRYAVPFAPYVPEVNPYLLPSALSIFPDNDECLLGCHAEAERRIDDMKMRLINRDFSRENRVYCAAFISLVLRFVRGWLLNTKATAYRNRPIVWLLNIGLPTDSYHDNELVSVYREIAQVAWTVSVLPGPVSLRQIENYVGKGQIDPSILPAPIKDRLLDSSYIDTFPEFVVQLVGYVRSPRRRENLHALIDVGAGTVDFTTFNVWRDKDGEDVFPIFARAVKPLGTRFLVEQRLQGAKQPISWKPSPFEDVPNDAEFQAKLALTESQLGELDQPFRKKVANVVREKLKFTKEHRIPLSPNWATGVPTFLCGGGARVGCYRDTFRGFSGLMPPYKLTLTAVDYPDDLQAPNLPKRAYDRLSVAYGLSYIPDDIGKILRQEEIEDDTRAQARKNYRDNFIDMDMM